MLTTWTTTTLSFTRSRFAWCSLRLAVTRGCLLSLWSWPLPLSRRRTLARAAAQVPAAAPTQGTSRGSRGARRRALSSEARRAGGGACDPEAAGAHEPGRDAWVQHLVDDARVVVCVAVDVVRHRVSLQRCACSRGCSHSAMFTCACHGRHWWCDVLPLTHECPARLQTTACCTSCRCRCCKCGPP